MDLYWKLRRPLPTHKLDHHGEGDVCIETCWWFHWSQHVRQLGSWGYLPCHRHSTSQNHGNFTLDPSMWDKVYRYTMLYLHLLRWVFGPSSCFYLRIFHIHTHTMVPWATSHLAPSLLVHHRINPWVRQSTAIAVEIFQEWNALVVTMA